MSRLNNAAVKPYGKINRQARDMHLENLTRKLISTAAAIVLSDFGGNFSFDDDTEILYGLPVRHFNSFMIAANEASISRLYGGIHFGDAVVNGQQMGRQTGEIVLKKIRLLSNK